MPELEDTQSQISILRYPDNVRKRKEMYIDNPNHCIMEIVDNAVDEHSAGHCTTIVVAVVDNEVYVEDDGRGIPVGKHKDPEYNHLSQAEVAYTVLHAGGKFGGEGSYKTATGGLHGVGASVVNALSESLTLKITTDGKEYQADFSRGLITEGLRQIGDGEPGKRGTLVQFKLDADMWGEEDFEYEALRRRLEQIAFLNPGLKMVSYVDTTNKAGAPIKMEKEFCYENGIMDYIAKLSKHKKQVSEVMNFSSTIDGIEANIAFVYADNYVQDIHSFVNNVETAGGGDHFTGFTTGLYKALETYAKEFKFIKETSDIESSDTREGLIAVVSVRVFDPKFEGQGKSKIKMPEVRTALNKFIKESVYDHLSQDPDRASGIMSKVLMAARARKAAKKAREATRGKKSLIDDAGLPGKLANCASKKPEECEIYFVEGDSAAGSAKEARDRNTQAILPIFGKILNVEKSSIEEIIKSEKLSEMLKALKCGFAEEFDITKLRYHKIILMNDADVDGGHILCLNLTFIYRYLRPLIEFGHVFAACPPLFLVKKGKQMTYLYTKQELEAFDTTGATVQRYKGLGEMNPEQLWDTTMNPATRRLIQITVDDLDMAEECLSLCMGSNVAARRQFILDSSEQASA